MGVNTSGNFSCIMEMPDEVHFMLNSCHWLALKILNAYIQEHPFQTLKFVSALLFCFASVTAPSVGRESLWSGSWLSRSTARKKKKPRMTEVPSVPTSVLFLVRIFGAFVNILLLCTGTDIHFAGWKLKSKPCRGPVFALPLEDMRDVMPRCRRHVTVME